ncbi:hypothetical protein IW262DRAFT_1464557 [Armillaria fumosa]|nr:hypothetical protein IW262DRAFT_1464557 [Armillaria fumosa]
MTLSDQYPDPNEYFYVQASGPACGGKYLHSKIILHSYTPPQSRSAYQYIKVQTLAKLLVVSAIPTPIYAEWLEELGYLSMLHHSFMGFSQNDLFLLVILPSLYEARSPPLLNEVLIKTALWHIYLFLMTFIKDTNCYLDSMHPQLQDEFGTLSSQLQNLKYPVAYASMPLPFKLKLDPQEHKAIEQLYHYVINSDDELNFGTFHQKTYSFLKAVLMAHLSIEK